LYLDDYDLGEFIGDSDETTGVRIDADEYSVSDTLSSDENDEEVGEFVGDDESFSVGDDVVLSQYTAEEAAAIIAEGLELDPSNILWDENGSPYVIVDAELEAQAVVFSLDEKVSNMTDVSDDTSTVKTSASSFSGGAEAATEFTDYNKNGYAIYKLSSSSSVNYKLTLKDTLPHITLTDGAEVYIGIIVDQLYDRKATATLNLSETPEYEDFTVAEAAKTAGADGNNNLRYTHVDSSQVKNKDGEHTFNSNSTLYKFTKGASVVFNATAWKAKAGSSITENLMSPENTENSTSSKNILRVNATSAKSVKFVDGNRTIDDTSYTGYLSLAGTGQPSYRSVLVNVKVGQTITIVATSGGTSPRTLVLSGTDAKNPYETMTVPINSATTMSAYTNTWTSTVDGPVYIYSSGSGINIYEISVN
jgi:hypothetical protein